MKLRAGVRRIGPVILFMLALGAVPGVGLGVARAAACPIRHGAVGDFTAANADDAVELAGQCQAGARKADNPAQRGHKIDVLYLPACTGNVPEANINRDASCPQALALCSATPVPDDSMFFRFERIDSGPWRRVGSACLTAGQVPGRGVPAFTVEDFRRLPLPAGSAHVEPGTRRTLLNVPTNVYVTAGPLTLTTTLLGQPVRVRATPVSYRWSFGDGGTLTTSDAGGAYPAMTTTHTYRQSGTVRIGLTTVYRGEYAVAGGGWLPVDGTAEVVSPAVDVTVVATRNELVADTLG